MITNLLIEIAIFIVVLIIAMIVEYFVRGKNK